MKRTKLLKTMSLALVGVLAAATLSACGPQKADTATDSASTNDSADSTSSDSSSSESSDASAEKVSGTLTAAGSSALLPLVQSAADAFMKENPDLAITVSGGGSGEGLKQVSDGAIDIGNSDVFAEEKLDEAAAKELTDHQVCIITMAPVVNKDLGIKSLTTQQLTDIFTAKVTNWKDVGGPDEQIMLVTRPSSSGTRALFKQWALGGAEEASNESLETDDSGTLLQTVKDNKGAIGYVALSYLVDNSDVSAVAIDDVEPSLENTYSGKYKVWGYEHIYTKGEGSANAKAFIDYMTGDKFSDQLESMGYGVTAKMSSEAVDSHK